jgi:hypothetical protein
MFEGHLTPDLVHICTLRWRNLLPTATTRGTTGPGHCQWRGPTVEDETTLFLFLTWVSAVPL